MTPVQVIEQFRREVDDLAQPQLWSDGEALLYLIDAQDQFVRLTGGIADTTVAAASVGNPPTRLPDLALTAGQDFTAHSPYILRIRSGRLLTARRDVKFISEGDVKNVTMDDYGLSRGVAFDDTQGDVNYGVLGVREKQVRWVRVPLEADTCRLHIQRLPYPRLPTDYADLELESLEVDEQHHLALTDWMKHKAYLKQDAEVYDKKKSDDCEARFRAYCEQSRRDREKQQYKPRSVQYGGL